MCESKRHGNAIMARWARDALKEYDRVSGGGCSEIATVPLVIASLLHFAEQQGRDGLTVAYEAIHLYQSEK